MCVCIYVTVYVTYEYNLIFIFISYFGGTLKDFVLFYLDFLLFYFCSNYKNVNICLHIFCVCSSERDCAILYSLMTKFKVLLGQKKQRSL